MYKSGSTNIVVQVLPVKILISSCCLQTYSSYSLKVKGVMESIEIYIFL